MAELSKPGRSTSDTMSSQMGSPSVSSKGCSYGVSGRTRSRIAARCSSTLRIATTLGHFRHGSARQHRAGGDLAWGALLAHLHLAPHDDSLAERPVPTNAQRVGGHQ